MEIKKPLYGVLSTAALAAGLYAVTPATSVDAAGGDFDLTIMHTNDTHAHLDNVARRISAIKDIRAGRDNSLLLDSGDVFSGTLFYNQYKGLADVKFMNMVGYDAMNIGNHEFDDGPSALAKFIKEANFPIVSSNIDFSKDANLNPLVKGSIGMPGDGGNIYPASIMEVDGEKIGIFGLTTEETAFLSSPGKDIMFEDHKKKAEETVKMLTDAGVNKIVALTHLGYNYDLKLGTAVKGIDVIVGGHSHTEVDNGTVLNEDAEPTIVVQAEEYSNFLGDLQVTFDSDGVLTDWDETLIDLNEKDGNGDYVISEDPEAKALLDELSAPLEEMKTTVVGSSDVFLNGERGSVRTQETNLGNMIADSMLEKAKANGKATIAIQNGGGIRASINQGPITLGEVLTTMPFGNTLVTLDLSGREIISSLEHGVSDVENGAGRFPHVAGMKFSYDASLEAGKRVLNVQVKTENGYENIDEDAMYTVATNNYVAGGGDGFEAFGKAKEDGRMKELYFVDYEVFLEYLENHKNVMPKMESRVVESGMDRIMGEDRYKTAVEISKKGWDSADTVVIARGDSFPDALAGAPLAYKHNAPILLTDKSSLTGVVKEEIKRLGAKNVIILGGSEAVSNYVMYQLEGMGLDVERIGGDDRWETAANIAASLGGSPEQAVVANGKNFPDALAVASYAARNGYPILLTDSNELPMATKNALTGIENTIVPGGEAAVNTKVFNMLPDATRYSGMDRYGTSAAIATDLNPSYRVYVANGKNFPDALAGAVLAAKNNASMVLVQPDMLPAETAKALQAIHANEFNILGGENAVSEEVVGKMKK
ncbi:cell wall-binding repeat-containing protein [Rossellomorea aquimaris]|uniref:cell wall-binding repeat-containing protein n=1 Tax=Rossellomorea aquimaris TaxID=189382 RepID=UPI001CD55ADA|nr:cell wall-binding repeat-containing protein [Rossellomorea aquimaris]MCA1061409.1 cell wall-binding repeat-containing protein [Rossellomorea aquimaris]